jgi:hypothetical protein
MMSMPGKSYRGTLPPLSPEQRALSEALRADVTTLTVDIGDRNVRRPQALEAAAAFVEGRLAALGYSVSRQVFEVDGTPVCNVEAELRGTGRPGDIVVVGAHYDVIPWTVGADDNGTGVAALLALARAFSCKRVSRTLRFVGFVNEEPPHFQTGAMGSLVYARRCKERGERITAAVSLESMGYFSDEPGSQKYPAPLSHFYPSEGNFIAFVGNVGSRRLVREVVGSFRKHARFPSEGAALPGWMPGVGWSDHWSFWQVGYPGVMVTDTAPFRNPHYHTADDTVDTLDFDRLARVVEGLEGVVGDLCWVERDR